MTSITKKLRGISSLIGNTPLLAINFKYRGEERVIYAKAEYLNMTGSIKDRMAFHILAEGYRRGLLKSGDRIVEAATGNTGISIASIGRALGHPLTIFMPDWTSKERRKIISSLGSDINLVDKKDGGFVTCMSLAKEMVNNTENTFLSRQFSNIDNIDAHYLTTGPEIWWQLKYRSKTPDAFVAGVGTGGTIMGVGKYLKENNPNIKIHALEPSNSPTISTGYQHGHHRIEGISDEFIPAIVDFSQLDEVESVDDGDSIIMAQQLAKQLGIGVGISSGANFLGALKVQNRLGKDAVVVTVFADSNKKYINTGLLEEEPIKSGFLSTDVQFESFKSFKRVCNTCCEPGDCVEANFNYDDSNVHLPYCVRRGKS
jgi:cysteine synthase A